MVTRGHHRTAWWARSNGNMRKGRHTVECRALPWLTTGVQFVSWARDEATQEGAMGALVPGTQPSARPTEGRLDSWKEIAAYLGRDVTTVQRWEKREKMPVHRHQHDRMGSVYAFSSELNAWLQTRRLRLEEEEAEKDRRGQASVTADVERLPRDPHVTRRWLFLGGVAVLAVLAVIYTLVRGHGNAVQPKIKSIAVLPLKNLSGDPTQDYLADGMTEALIGRLSAIHDLRVISRTSVMGLKDTRLSVPEIASKLHVDAIVEGSVIREGNQVRVNAQLIRGATDEHFWSEAYDRELQDALALQSEVAQSIARKVEVTVTGKEHERLAAARHVSPEVYESYLKGSFTLEKSNSKAEVEQSISYFGQAIDKDPTFAPAYVGLATSYMEISTVFYGAPPQEAHAKAMSAARKALELDPELAEAHIIVADLLQTEWRWAEAEAEYRRALELAPSGAAAQDGFAGWLLSQGRPEEALAWAERAREHDPLAISGIGIGWILFQARRYGEADRELRSALQVQPDEPSALFFLGFVLNAKGQPELAVPVLEKALSVSHRSPAVIGVLIRAYAHAGRRTDALHLLEELKQRQRAGYVPAAAFVNAYLGLDNKEQAFAWLERAYQEHSNILLFLRVHPFFDPLRGDPRFADLVHRVGLG